MSALRRYAGVRLCLDVQFWFPVWLIFLLHQGFSLAEAALADGLFRVVVVLLEIPLGMLGDRWGRRTSLLTVTAATALVYAAIGFIATLPALVLAWVAWGVLWAMASGLETAYAWELAEQEGMAPERYLGQVRAVTGVAGFFSLLSAGWLFEVRPALPFVITAALAVVALPVAATLPDIDRSRLRGHHVSMSGLKDLITSPGPAIRIALGALVLLAGWTVQILFQPLGVDLGVAPGLTGLVYAGFALARGLGGLLGARLIEPTHGWVPAGVAVLGMACLGVWGSVSWGRPWVALWVLLPVIGVAHAAITTVTDVWASAATHPHARATVLSMMSCFGGVAMAVARPGLVLAADGHRAAPAFGLWGAVCLCLAVVAFFGWRRVATATVSGSG